MMDHPAVIFRFISDWKRRQGWMTFREILVTQVREVLRAWLAGAGKRPPGNALVPWSWQMTLGFSPRVRPRRRGLPALAALSSRLRR